MSRFISSALLSFVLIAGPVARAAPPPPVGTPEDFKAITEVTEEFQAALLAQDAKRLSALVLNPNILFTSPASEAFLRKSREMMGEGDDGVPIAGFRDFARAVFHAKPAFQEKFYNVKITQDAHLAWVQFDYEFLQGGKVQNYGVEHWNMVRRDGKWKIFSVVWSSHSAQP